MTTTTAPAPGAAFGINTATEHPPTEADWKQIGETTTLAVSYLRVSTKEQAERGGRDEGFSIPAQREANLRKARDLRAIVVESSSTRGPPRSPLTGPSCCG